MRIRDEIARRSVGLTREEIHEGFWAHEKPWLDWDAEAYRAYREGESPVLPAPHGEDPIHAVMMAGVQGEHVLCLAGGGGPATRATASAASWFISAVAQISG